jgi:hypothetical protein
LRTKLTGDIPLLPDEVKLGPNPDYVGLSLEFSLGKTTPKEIWESKGDWSGVMNASKEEWGKMADDQREAIINLVTGALERMHDRVEEWVPEGLVVTGGEFLDINLRVLFTDVDKAIDRNEQATSFQIDEAQTEVEGWISEIAA